MYFLSKAPTKTKTVGKIYLKQMYIRDRKDWILSRISPKCMNCSSNKYYDVNCISKVFLFIIQYDKTYKIVCPECGETIELDLEEFLIIESFIKVNKKYDEGKISHQGYEYKMQKIYRKHSGK